MPRFYKPIVGAPYYMINSRFEIKQTTHTGSERSSKRIRAGNCFPTKVEVQEFRTNLLHLRNGRVVQMKKWWEFWK